MRPRGSIVGPLILITVGVLFLAHTAWPAFSVFSFLSTYWPYLLILWGLLQIAEISVRATRNGALPRSGISGAGWFLILLISVFGFVAFEVHGPDAWWRRTGFNHEMDWFGDAYDFTVASQSHSAGKNPRIVIEQFRGSAKISGSDANEITVSGHKTVRAMKSSEAKRADSDSPIQVSSDGDTITIRTNQQQVPGKVRVTTDLDISVPRGASIEASGRAGDFDVSGLSGDVHISSDNAGVRLQDIGGNVSVNTEHGDVVRCINIKGAVDLRGHSSDLELDRIAGPVTVHGAYSGTLTLKALMKPLHLDNLNTTVSVQKVNGEITMDRGSFSAQNITGPAQVSTRAMDVEISGFAEPLEINVDKGDINLRPGKGTLSQVSARTQAGNIVLALPEAAKFDLSASTDHGEIQNDFGSPLKIESAGKGARLMGAVGAGPTLNLTTDRGTITVRKGSGPAAQEASSEDDFGSDGGMAPKVPAPAKPPSPPKISQRFRLTISGY